MYGHLRNGNGFVFARDYTPSYLKNSRIDTTRHNCMKQTLTYSYGRIRTLKIEIGKSTRVSLRRFDTGRIGAKRIWVGRKINRIGDDII